MPKLTVEGIGACDVDEGTRLVNAVEACGANLGHRCGGQAKCTTCRVKFTEGEPEVMTRAEYEKLRDTRALGKYRLACQITVDRPMTVEPLMLLGEMNWDDTGPPPEPTVEPEAEWFPREELEGNAS